MWFCKSQKTGYFDRREKLQQQDANEKKWCVWRKVIVSNNYANHQCCKDEADDGSFFEIGGKSHPAAPRRFSKLPKRRSRPAKSRSAS